MTLLQGVVNAFVMFFARVVAYAVTSLLRQRDSESRSSFLYPVLVFAFELVFMILGAIIVATFSRAREYRADGGGAKLAGRDQMIQALKKLKTVVAVQDPRSQHASFQALKISNPGGILRLFSTHPPIDDRIARLEGRSA
jgi:heat shock protein HtpX